MPGEEQRLDAETVAGREQRAVGPQARVDQPDQHKEHADLLAKTIGKLGGKAVTAKSKYEFPVEQLKSQADVLKFAAKLEKGAVSAYLGETTRLVP